MPESMPLLLCAPRDTAKLAPCCAPSANDVTLSPCFDASQDDVEDNEESTRAFQQRALAGDADDLYQLGQAYRQGKRRREEPVRCRKTVREGDRA